MSKKNRGYYNQQDNEVDESQTDSTLPEAEGSEQEAELAAEAIPAEVQPQESQAEVQQSPQEQPQETVKVKAPVVETKQEGVKIVTAIQAEITNFVEGITAPGSNTPQTFGIWRFSLLRTMQTILSRENGDTFKAEWQTLLATANANKDKAFNEGYIFRHPGVWKGSEKEYKLLRRLAYLVMATADAATRKAAVSEIKLETVAEGLTETQRNNLFSFYA